MGNDNQLAQGCGCLWYATMGICGAFALHPIVGIIAIVVVICIWISSEKEQASYNRPSNTTVQTTIIKPTHQPQSKTLEFPQNCDPSLRLAITKNLSPAKKINHESFRQELLGHGITCFYHFTDVRNLENIRKYGGLISWYSCAKHEIGIISAGGDGLSRNLDVRYNLQDYVRLSFCRDHPMAYKHKLAGKKLVLLMIKIDVALWEDTLFSNMNATDNEHSHGGSLNDLKRIDFAAVKKNFVSRDDSDFKFHQAEILVKTAIPKEFIVNLDNPIYL